MILLVTGGSASGKSEYAENRALQLAKTEQKKLIYLAAMKNIVGMRTISGNQTN